jgi:hypothetical protein
MLPLLLPWVLLVLVWGPCPLPVAPSAVVQVQQPLQLLQVVVVVVRVARRSSLS